MTIVVGVVMTVVIVAVVDILVPAVVRLYAEIGQKAIVIMGRGVDLHIRMPQDRSPDPRNIGPDPGLDPDVYLLS
jgi:hypothetical protein